jgi:hypothetical protein
VKHIFIYLICKYYLNGRFNLKFRNFRIFTFRDQDTALIDSALKYAVLGVSIRA